jgi:GTP cyclohydrolase FolE2
MPLSIKGGSNMTEKDNNQEALDAFADKAVQEESRQISDNLSFNTRSLSSVSERVIENLSASKITIQKILDAMETALNRQEQIVSKMNDESRLLC